MIGVWSVSARLNACAVRRKHSSGLRGARIARGQSPWPAPSARFRSPCSVFVGKPVDGPLRCTRIATKGVSVMPAWPIASTIREKPPPDVAVIARTPAKPAPTAMFIAASSSSTCLTTTPCGGPWEAIQWRIEDAGVIGYCARNLTPAASAPRQIASFPVIRYFGSFGYANPRFREPPISATASAPSFDAWMFCCTISGFLSPQMSLNALSTCRKSMSNKRTAAPRATVFRMSALGDRLCALLRRGIPSSRTFPRSFAGSSHQRHRNLIYSCMSGTGGRRGFPAQAFWPSGRSGRERRASGPRSAEASEAPRPLFALRRRERIRVHIRAGAHRPGSEGGGVGRSRRRRPDEAVAEEHIVNPRRTRALDGFGREDDRLPHRPRGFPGDERGLQGILSG